MAALLLHLHPIPFCSVGATFPTFSPPDLILGGGLGSGGTWLYSRGGHISMGKFQSGFLKKHIIFPGCICFPDYKNIGVELFDDPGKREFWPCVMLKEY